MKSEAPHPTKAARQNIDGVLLLDKPVGWTSNAALQKAKWLLNAAKAGHTGTLDPFASGLLPVCFGQATKFSSHALHGNKTYRATLKLGATTTTGDIEGEVLETRPVNVTLQQVQDVLPRFTGEIQQVPPMYSALKHQGKALYEYARAGIEIERKARTITIFRLQLIALQGDELVLEVDCSGGTYIRTLAEDIGKKLSCGAHLTALRRTASGNFSIENTLSLEALETLPPEVRQAQLLPSDSLVTALPQLELDHASALQLAQGKQPDTPAGTKPGLYRAYTTHGFFGLVEAAEKLSAQRLMNTSQLFASD